MKMVPKPSKSSKTNGNKKNVTTGNDEEEKTKEDRSILRQPMDIGIRDVRDLVKALAGGTQEFQDILLNECTIIYECKICRNLFRSLANFISHKRVYCINTFNYFTHGFSELQTERKPEIVQENEVTVEPEPPQNNTENDTQNGTWVTSDKNAENATETEDNTCVVVPQIKTEPYRITRKKDIAKIVDGLSKKGGKEIVKTSNDVPDSTYYSDIAERVMMRRNAKKKSVIELENVSDTCNGVFQTVKLNDSNSESIKVQLDELDRVVSRNQAILQENGKFTVTVEKSDDLKNLERHKCSFCDAQFITLQTLNRHVSMYHRKSICFPCPLCKVFFATPTSVYRHLTKSHHRNEQQIRRLRSQIFSKASERKLLQSPTKIMPNANGELKTLEKEKEQWINNFEGVLRCSSCRKLFSRRAVLSVHLASCKERLAQQQIAPKPVQTVQQQPQPAPATPPPPTPVLHQQPEQPPKLQQQQQTPPQLPPKPKAAVKPTSLIKVTPPSPKPVPKIRNKDSPVAKSGIIVRKDYCKKLSSSSNSFSSPSATNCYYSDDSFSKLQVVVKKLEEKNILEFQKNMNGPVPIKSTKNKLRAEKMRNEKIRAEKIRTEKVRTKKIRTEEIRTEKVKQRKSEKTEKDVTKNKSERIAQKIKEPEPEKETKPIENNEKEGSLTPDEASLKSERFSPVESVSSTVSSNRTNPYKLRKKKNNSDDNGSTETEITNKEEADINSDHLVVNNENSKDGSNIENEGGHSVGKVESVLRRTKRARTLVKNKEFVYNNIKRISPTANKCRAKSIKKAVKHLNYNGSMLLLHKNLNLLKNNGDSKLIKFFPRIL